MRSPLTEIYHKVQGMISYVRENLSTDEYMLYLDLLVPEPEPIVKVAKKARKKRAAKSAHQQSLSSAIQRERKGKVDAASDDEDGPRCMYTMGDNAPCNATEHSPVHKPDGGYLKWHEFQPGKSQAATGD